jgi:hypothetical protein
LKKNLENYLKKMQENEDLMLNKFFIALKGKYKTIYANAERNCNFICIPSNNSLLDNHDFTQEEIESHIFNPSPFILGEYISLNKKTMEIDESIITTKKGKKEK